MAQTRTLHDPRESSVRVTALANNVKTLQGHENRLRLRVGDWRVLFNENGEVVAVLRVAPRVEAYD